MKMKDEDFKFLIWCLFVPPFGWLMLFAIALYLFIGFVSGSLKRA